MIENIQHDAFNHWTAWLGFMIYKYKNIATIFFIIIALQACQGLSPSLDLSKNPFSKSASAPALKWTGPALTCNIHSGSANFSGNWYDFKPSTVEIYKGQEKEIMLSRKWGKDTAPLYIRYEQSGQKLVLCPIENVQDGQKILCTSIYAIEEDFDMGVKRTLDISKIIRGGNIECRTDKSASNS